MTDNLVNRLRHWQQYGPYRPSRYKEAADRIEELERELAEERQSREVAASKAWEFADRIKELERHVEVRDFFLVENDLWERFTKGAEGKMK